MGAASERRAEAAAGHHAVPSRANRRVGRGRLGALPPDCDDGGHDRWTDKQSDQAKGLQAAEDA